MPIFLPVPGFDDYLVSDEGQVISLLRAARGGARKPCWRVLKPSVAANGYVHYGLCRDGKIYTKKGHRLVMEAFLGASTLHVNHKNAIKNDNRLENLEYCTPAENSAHATRMGLQKKHLGEQNGMAKLSDAEALQLLALKGQTTESRAAKEFNVSSALVHLIWSGQCRAHLSTAA